MKKDETKNRKKRRALKALQSINSTKDLNMATVVVTITSEDISVPATTVPAGWVVRLASLAQTISQSLLMLPANNQVEFADVPPGTYVPQAERLDSAGAIIGATASGPSFIVPVPPPETINVSIPATVFAAPAVSAHKGQRPPHRGR